MPKALGKIFALFLLLALSSLAYAGTEAQPAAAQPTGWKAVVADHAHAPSFLIAVDKEEQLVRVFERKSPLTKIAEYVCTTGQKHGDKLVEGDLKTPEGVYFVVSYINAGLDFTLYGKEAYPLNYPNPVDRLRKKTGYGIWIHGKGIPLVPYDSNGCVGMNNNDIAELKAKPLIGQPVTLALDIVEQSPEEAKAKADTAALLAVRVEDWAKAWSARSADMFEFYNPEAYSIAQREPFKNFKAQKEHLFKVLPWIKTSVSDIQVLEGPGYWVTWFNQDYAAPNLKSSGTRRLYWQPDADGELRIVGMEWLVGFKSPVLYADASSKVASSVSDAGGEPKTEAVQAAPDNSTQAAADPAEKQAVAEKAGTAGESSMTVAVTPQRVQAAPSVAATNERDQAEIDKMLAREGRDFIQGWQAAWQAQDINVYSRCYAPAAIQGKRNGRAQIIAQKEELWSRVKVNRLELSDIQIQTTSRGLKASMTQNYADSGGYSDNGVKTLHLEFDNGWRIVREDWEDN